MLIPLLNDDDMELKGPSDSIRKSNFIPNNNIHYEKDINNKKNNINIGKNIFPKKRVLNINNKSNDNFNNDYNYSSNKNNYYNHKSEPNYQPKNSINKNYKSTLNEINLYPNNKNQEDMKYSKMPNISKYSNVNNNLNNIYLENNNNINNNNINKNFEKINNEQVPINNDNNHDNEFSKINYEIKDYKAENLAKNEYYVKYVALNRQGYEYIKERDYKSAMIIFQQCFDLSKNYLKEDIKQINSLINISICQYYSGNFTESLTSINKAKILYDSFNQQNWNISTSQLFQLTLKLFINSSLSNLSLNNCKESKNDIIYLLSIIRKESDLERQNMYYKSIIYSLFRTNSLLNLDTNDILEEENMEQDKIINNLMKGFIRCLKENDVEILLNRFKEASRKYQKLNDGNGYYFSLYYHYLILLDLKRNNLNENEINEIKNKISFCNDKLIGNEFINQFQEKDVNKLLNEFKEKISCACDIYQILENFEKELNNKLEVFNKEKSNINFSDDENNISTSRLLDKSHLLTNDKINHPIFVKLLLRFSLMYLEGQKKNITENYNDLNNDNNMLDNYKKLIEEVKTMNEKIETKEINIENIQLHQLDREMINSLKQLFDNLIYIRYKVILYHNFKKYRAKVRKRKNAKIVKKIINFLSYHNEKLVDGLNLIKINFKSNGFKTHFYDIDNEKLTFNIRSNEYNKTSKSYNFARDIIKITYGMKSRNLRKKLLMKDKEPEMLRLLRCPWRFISIITKSRSLDFYCDDEQINNMFYGMKQILIEKDLSFKINSATYYLLNKTKIKICIEIKKKYQQKDEKHIPKIVNDLLQEKGIQNISFVKLFLIYNKYMNI